ncbi:MAG: ArsR family transcriptional regulator [Mobiluncus porci]|uniref:ArsR family transcriptional regulator n=1 Tax=Mobiluncus porci TaxID=2652278 RepID=A0A7K0K136_9ACTO|nr:MULTISPECIES: ArsR family transcriptional regulator [Mobiluncus]MCI6585269.1 ArsR family transcriptional regulator [Mobiluncus sp.]MDD7541520.1 ArsR family transcriptional regulator [Mobiluncus porci]MDY5748505.1 ArsR family transcriptional regulator [Mobiluncus porci]MST48735.1 ArsR family transcriptional regulator [Mobiluncus porci]
MQLPVDDQGTRQVVLDLIIEKGPITASTLANILKLTPAAVRRHLIYLENSGQIENLDPTSLVARGRGRPARNYVATDAGRATRPDGYSRMATKALEYLKQVAGSEAIEDFANRHSREVERRYAPVVHAAGEDPEARVVALADALAQDGYAATVRHTKQGLALQLCQGSCPVQDVAKNFPKLCEAETQAFSRLLDTHIQRLATIADGDHACTTSVPLMLRTNGVNGGTKVTLRAGKMK